ncbi:hypothetical protein ACYFX5_16335 [Bremerella sp. T1]|uniref:hypothetical protein n=1 Tax=Bremerella sp. TYQ1 TaxID=3119568 RepID=UPI001CD01E41|nr:hypothetical protein [Bremerella volcania]UBM34626.1 hypothetical protein LA756_18285 [Bremerella volcania]
MKLDSTTRFWLASFAVGSAMTAFAIVGMTVGLQFRSDNAVEIPVNATASTWSETMCAATGRVDEEMEGLFTLDALTGDLQCSVLNGRTTKFGGLFRTNVLQDIGADASKKPSFMILTGFASFPGQGGNTRPGDCVVYVIDSTTGRFAVYGVPWQRSVAARGAPQQGALILLDTGTARNVMIRDS